MTRTFTAVLTQRSLKRHLFYDQFTGKWTWLIPTSNRVKAGDVAGTVGGDNRRQIGIFGEQFLSSRLAVFYMTGEWPKNDVDHKNLDRLDDSWDNLRPANRSGNMANVRRHSNNKCGFKGVYFDKRRGLYVAEITKDYKKTFLGYFSSPEQAHAVYSAAALLTHGEFARVS